MQSSILTDSVRHGADDSWTLLHGEIDSPYIP